MSVGRICCREVVVASSCDTAATLAQRMRAEDVGSVVIIDAHYRPVGIVTDRDLALRVMAEGRDPLRTSASDVMTPAPQCLREEMPTESALSKMEAAKFRRLPVVDSSGRLVGIVTLDDILRQMSAEFERIGSVVRGKPAMLELQA